MGTKLSQATTRAVFIPITWIYLCRFVLPFPITHVEGGESRIIQKELYGLGSMNRGEKIVATVFCFTAMLWIFRRPIVLGEWILPGWSNLFVNPKFFA